MFNIYSLGLRLKIIPLVSLIGFVLMAGVALHSLSTTLNQEKENQVISVVDLALGIIDRYQTLEAEGQLTRTQAQQEALATLRNLRYDAIEYIWVNDLSLPTPKMIMHPTVPDLEGQVMDGSRFEHATLARNREGDQQQRLDNQNLFVAFVETVNRYGAGFVEYQWPKPLAGGGVTDERYTKLSYVTADQEWGWMVGTGIYIDDVSTQFWLLAVRIGVLAIIGVLMMLFFAYSCSVVL